MGSVNLLNSVRAVRHYVSFWLPALPDNALLRFP